MTQFSNYTTKITTLFEWATKIQKCNFLTAQLPWYEINLHENRLVTMKYKLNQKIRKLFFTPELPAKFCNCSSISSCLRHNTHCIHDIMVWIQNTLYGNEMRDVTVKARRDLDWFWYWIPWYTLRVNVRTYCLHHPLFQFRANILFKIGSIYVLYL